MTSVTIIWLLWCLSGFLWFWLLRPAQAATVCIVGGMTLLPNLPTELVLAPDWLAFGFTKHHAGSLATLLGLLSIRLPRTARAPQRISTHLNRRETIGWFDVPMILWIAMPIATAIANQSDLWQVGLADALNHLLHWGVPYFAARLVLTNLQAILDFMMIVAGAGLLLVGPCLYESWVGPQAYLQVLLFDGPVPSEGHARRMGGWRPHCMFGNGIRLGRAMAVSALVAGALSLFESIHPNRLPLPTCIPRRWRLTALVTMTVVLAMAVIGVRSASWLYLAILGSGFLVATVYAPRKIISGVLIAGAVVTFAAMVTRIANLADPQPVVEMVEAVSQRAAGSLAFRLKSERLYIDRTLDSPYRWLGSNQLPNRYVHPYYSDQRYIMALRDFGLIGLLVWLSTLYWPWLQGMRWFIASGNCQLSTALVCGLHLWLIQAIVWDSLFNAFVNPVFYMIAGAVVTFGKFPR